MKYLVFNCSSLANPHFGIQMNEAIKLHNENHEVVFSYCSGCMCSCNDNIEANGIICSWCVESRRAGTAILPKAIKKVPLKTIKRKRNICFDYNTVKELKCLEYKNVSIGCAVLSSYISITRNPLPDVLEKKTKMYIDNLLSQAVSLTDAVDEMILLYNPDKIVLYNGRLYESRPLVDLAIKYEIEYRCMEVIGGCRMDEAYKIVYFENSLPHDIKANFDKCNETWIRSSLVDEEKCRIGKSFFERRRAGVPAADKVYIKNQEKGKLPTNVDSNKKNIVIFNSSEDEFAALGDEFDSYALFQTQYDGIVYILEQFKDNNNFHFYLRIHPNLQNVRHKYHMDLYNLSYQFNNITVISAENSVSTYDLLDIADKVVVFGSTIGVEAAYWGKPVILLGAAFYYYLKVCYIPDSPQHLITLLCQELDPLDKKDAIKYGYFLLDDAVLPRSAEYIDINPKKNILFGRFVWVYRYMKLFRSSLLYKIATVFVYRILSKCTKNKFVLPEKRSSN